MEVYKNLYSSGLDKHMLKKSLKSLKKRQSSPLLYLVLLTKCGKLEIIHSIFFASKENEYELLLGLALGKRRAFGIVADMLRELYEETGGFAYYEYYMSRRK